MLLEIITEENVDFRQQKLEIQVFKYDAKKCHVHYLPNAMFSKIHDEI